MMSIRTYKKQEDLCLVKFSGHYFIGWMDLPQKDWSVEQFNKYLGENVYNFIDLTGSYTPQTMQKSSLDIVFTFGEISESYKFETKNENPKQLDFKQMLIAILQSENPVTTFLQEIKKLYL